MMQLPLSNMLIALLVAVAVAPFALPVTAAELTAQPTIIIGSRATDNLRWASEDKESALGFDMGGGVQLNAAAPSWSTTISPDFNIRRFLIGEDVDADEYGVRTTHSWTPNEKLLTEVEVNYTRDSTLTTELTDAGRQNDVANRDTVLANPRLTYAVDSLSSITASYLYTDVKFSDDGDGRLIDYRYTQFSGGFNRILSDRIQVNLASFVSEFEVASQNSKTLTYGGQVGSAYAFDKTMSVNAAVGYLNSEIDFLQSSLAVVIDPVPRIVVVQSEESISTSGPIATFGIDKRFEYTRLRFDYARRVSPTIRGSQSLEDDIVARVDRRVSREWMLGFRGGYNLRTSESQDIAGNIADLNRDQASVSGYTAYRLTENMQVRGEYRFAHSVISSSGRSVATNALFLTFTYNGDAVPLSEIW